MGSPEPGRERVLLAAAGVLLLVLGAACYLWTRAPAALAWAAVNVAFELGQHPRAAAALGALLADMGADTGPFALLDGYFRHGTFDPLDVAAAGAALLACLAAAFPRRRSRR